MNQWQPIETAPRDKRVLLGRAGSNSRWSVFIGSLSGDGNLWTDEQELFRDPTHWQPLPPPPEQQETPEVAQL